MPIVFDGHSPWLSNVFLARLIVGSGEGVGYGLLIDIVILISHLTSA